MPSGPAVFAWIWLNRKHKSFMNYALDQIGSRSGDSTVSVYSSGTAGLATYHTALPAPTDGIPREGESYKSSNRNGVMTGRNGWRGSKLTRSR
jgi:hypothetical protein